MEGGGTDGGTPRAAAAARRRAATAAGGQPAGEAYGGGAVAPRVAKGGARGETRYISDLLWIKLIGRCRKGFQKYSVGDCFCVGPSCLILCLDFLSRICCATSLCG